MQPVQAPLPDSAATLQRHFIEVEKNLISIGFFTPSSSRMMTAERKTTSIVRYVDGQKMETAVSIFPSAYYGLPVTADQDKYFALQMILQGLRQRAGTIPNPVGFTSAEMLRILDLKKNGKNYQEVMDWMKRMTATTITAAIYFAGRKVWVEDTFHVFDRAVGKGMEISEGRIADMNYVWLSPWQRENIESSFQIPIDFEAYRRLRNHIAKALVPLLQIWLYSSMHTGRFEKSYADLCQLLNIRRYEHISKIKGVLRPSLDELMEIGYISAWDIEPRANVDDYKISLQHGAKFFADRELRLGREKSPGNTLVEELVTRGVAETVARQLVAQSPSEETLRDQMEWGDHLIRTSRGGRFHNPAGFYVYLLRNRVLPPPDFESSRVRTLREAQTASAAMLARRRLEIENEYQEYRMRQIAEAREAKYPGEALTTRLAQLMNEIRTETPEAGHWLPARLETLARQRLDAEIAVEIELLSLEEFVARQASQFRLF